MQILDYRGSSNGSSLISHSGVICSFLLFASHCGPTTSITTSITTTTTIIIQLSIVVLY